MPVPKVFDAIIVGAGPGGYVCAIRCAQLGLKTAVIEREHLGGICLNWGCIPTKALLRTSEVFQTMKRAGDYGLSAEKVDFNLQDVIKRSRAIAAQLNQGVGHLLRKNKVEVRMATAEIAGADRVFVKNGKNDVEELAASAIVIATGARARELPELQSDGKVVWTYKHALDPKRMPKKLLVIGSGAIGIEFASFYNALGAETTVVEVLERILPAEDPEISEFARKSFSRHGMKIFANSRVRVIERSQASVAAEITQKGSKSIRDVFDTVIVAVGIDGNVEGMGLERIGVELDRGHILVDGSCRTSAQGIFAIGDVAGPPWLAHKASHEGVMVAEILAGGSPHQVTSDKIAGCTYCHPQIASVGLTEENAVRAGREIRVGRFPFVGNGKAIALGEPDGLVKTIFDSETGELLGAHMIGAEVTELIQGFVVARQLETTESDLIHSVFPHPTLSEMMHESVLDAYGRTIHF
ncbi:MAG: dihydrolipoyl dehydrogenase [Albidovulum sp.]|nr:dihydrolipoyl dehydrogenase [Albidovulum sp.]MDE0304143.1 dihydrolipoyl dehydrogenase [Albidovulum sp.]MDE0533457.1 dihydrolipoyl dehydrogenase [Albidovulum sp.]